MLARNPGTKEPGDTVNVWRLLFPQSAARFTSTVYVFVVRFGAVTTIVTSVLNPGAFSVTARLVVVWPLMLTVAPASCAGAPTVTLPTPLPTATV